jgi:hypothetical protein
VRLAAHRIEVELPAGWDGRIYRHDGGAPVLHAASFGLPPSDGDFGSGATGLMPEGGAFLALKEFVPDRHLHPGKGLFADSYLPLPLDPRSFHPRALQVGRLAQAGMQRFFTTAGRPFCLYAVISTVPARSGHATRAVDRVAQLSRIASSLTIGAPR